MANDDVVLSIWNLFKLVKVQQSAALGKPSNMEGYHKWAKANFCVFIIGVAVAGVTLVIHVCMQHHFRI